MATFLTHSRHCLTQLNLAGGSVAWDNRRRPVTLNLTAYDQFPCLGESLLRWVRQVSQYVEMLRKSISHKAVKTGQNAHVALCHRAAVP